jgi:hypothetical protein
MAVTATPTATVMAEAAAAATATAGSLQRTDPATWMLLPRRRRLPTAAYHTVRNHPERATSVVTRRLPDCICSRELRLPCRSCRYSKSHARGFAPWSSGLCKSEVAGCRLTLFLCAVGLGPAGNAGTAAAAGYGAQMARGGPPAGRLGGAPERFHPYGR